VRLDSTSFIFTDALQCCFISGIHQLLYETPVGNHLWSNQWY